MFASNHYTLGAGPSIITRLLVADTQAGSLIGKQGSTIKSIQDGSGCIIRVLGSENLPMFALRYDSVVEVQGEPTRVHKAVEIITVHLRKFLVDRGIVGLFETKANANAKCLSQLQCTPTPTLGSSSSRVSSSWWRWPTFAPPSKQYMPPLIPYDNYYPTADLPPMDKQFHQAALSAYGRDPFAGIHPPSAQPQQSDATK
ncbi:hypothetical protein HN873_056428, partial [Arachis hypogaea]